MRIFVARQIAPSSIDILRQAGHDVQISPHDRVLTPAELVASTKDRDGLLAMPSDRVDATFLDARPNIRCVANHAVGFNNIDVPACTARKVGVSNTPGVLTDATAEIAWVLILMAARCASESERILRAKNWNGWGPLQFLGMNVAGQTLGIIGAGRIGTRVAQMARGFDMRIVYNSRRASPELDTMGATSVSLDDLLRQSDFVSLHVPLNDQTRHLIGAPQLAVMKPTAILINTTRGPVVDEAALVEALKARRIFAAGLDVYEQEPTVHPGLYELENAVLLPHIGSATLSTRTKMAEMAARNLIAMLAGKRPENPVNAELWPV